VLQTNGSHYNAHSPPNKAPKSADFPDPVLPETNVNFPIGNITFMSSSLNAPGAPCHSNEACSNPICVLGLSGPAVSDEAQAGTSGSDKYDSIRCIET
jgi:hypothetical protein